MLYFEIVLVLGHCVNAGSSKSKFPKSATVFASATSCDSRATELRCHPQTAPRLMWRRQVCFILHYGHTTFNVLPLGPSVTMGLFVFRHMWMLESGGETKWPPIYPLTTLFPGIPSEAIFATHIRLFVSTNRLDCEVSGRPSETTVLGSSQVPWQKVPSIFFCLFRFLHKYEHWHTELIAFTLFVQRDNLHFVGFI